MLWLNADRKVYPTVFEFINKEESSEELIKTTFPISVYIEYIASSCHPAGSLFTNSIGLHPPVGNKHKQMQQTNYQTNKTIKLKKPTNEQAAGTPINNQTITQTNKPFNKLYWSASTSWKHCKIWKQMQMTYHWCICLCLPAFVLFFCSYLLCICGQKTEELLSGKKVSSSGGLWLVPKLVLKWQIDAKTSASGPHLWQFYRNLKQKWGRDSIGPAESPLADCPAMFFVFFFWPPIDTWRSNG